MARTARQRAALRKAQLASARKRRKGGRSRTRKYAKRAAIGVGVGVLGTVGFGVNWVRKDLDKAFYPKKYSNGKRKNNIRTRVGLSRRYAQKHNSKRVRAFIHGMKIH
jgi:hypothetical protein